MPAPEQVLVSAGTIVYFVALGKRWALHLGWIC